MVKWKILALVVFGMLGMTTTMLLAEDSINLLDHPAIRDNGAYTYFARGNAMQQSIPPLTKTFYPGGWKRDGKSHHGLHGNKQFGSESRDGRREDTGHNAGPIPLRQGALTNHSKDRTWGWIGVLSPDRIQGQAVTGSFDILFDLGQTCWIQSVEIDYMGVPGNSWLADQPDLQKVYTTNMFIDPEHRTDADLALWATGTFKAKSSKSVELKMTSPKVKARYVVLRLMTTTSIKPGDTASMGGILQEIRIIGQMVKKQLVSP
ncbi:MAG: hypothetical protein ACF8OB_00565 [Phycisphaeraceae bacterium JB051]